MHKAIRHKTLHACATNSERGPLQVRKLLALATAMATMVVANLLAATPLTAYAVEPAVQPTHRDPAAVGAKSVRRDASNSHNSPDDDPPQSASPTVTDDATDAEQMVQQSAAAAAKATTLATVRVVGKAQTEDLENLPSSIAVMSSGQIAALAAQRLSDLGNNFANVSITPAQVTIRGVGNASHIVGFTNRVGVYIDGVYVGQSIALDQELLGISSVEVLRGPQGTLFGQNTVAGAINIVTERPSHEFEANLAANVGNLDLRQAQFHVSGPVADGVYAGLSVGRTVRNGYVHDTFLDETLGGRNRKALRGQLEIDRFQNWTIYAAADYMKADERPGVYSPLSDTFGVSPNTDAPGRYDTSSNIEPRAPQQLEGASLEADYALPNGSTLKSISSYRDNRLKEDQDLDYSPANFIDAYYQYNYKQYTQEFQFLSAKNGNFNYVLGAFYYRMDAENQRNINTGSDAGALGLPPNTVVPLYATMRTTTGALYGNATYHLSVHWAIEGGIRWSHDRETPFYDIDTAMVPAFGLATGIFHQPISNTETTPTATVTYNINDNSRFYVRYAKGYKSGGFNMDFISASLFPDHVAFNPEVSNDYEAGFKSKLLDDRMMLNADIFHTTYDHYQLSQFIRSGDTGEITLTNAGKVRTQGAELDSTVLAAPGLQLRASIGYLDAFFVDFPDATADGENFAGHRLPDAPRFTASISANYSHQLGSTGYYGGLNINYSYRTGYYSDEFNLKQTTLGGNAVRYGYTPAYGLLDASYTVTSPSGKWDTTIWARNVTNKYYVINYFQDFFGTYVSSPGEPRTFGIRVNYHFHD